MRRATKNPQPIRRQLLLGDDWSQSPWFFGGYDLPDGVIYQYFSINSISYYSKHCAEPLLCKEVGCKPLLCGHPVTQQGMENDKFKIVLSDAIVGAGGKFLAMTPPA